jgi:type IV secretion system protein VirD4
MVALTQITTPPIPHVKPDPSVARNSLRVIAAAEAEAPSSPTVAGTALPLNPVAMAAANAVPEESKVATLFNGILNINQFADAGGEW